MSVTREAKKKKEDILDLKKWLQVSLKNTQHTTKLIQILTSCITDLLASCADISTGAADLMRILKDGNEINAKTAILQEGALKFSKIIVERISKCQNEYAIIYTEMLKENMEVLNG